MPQVVVAYAKEDERTSYL